MRIKGGWEPGTVVLTNRGEFRIAGVDDRTMEAIRNIPHVTSAQSISLL